jgi:membrane protein implicated in regulation of membrane protease activity
MKRVVRNSGRSRGTRAALSLSLSILFSLLSLPYRPDRRRLHVQHLAVSGLVGRLVEEVDQVGVGRVGAEVHLRDEKWRGKGEE